MKIIISKKQTTGTADRMLYGHFLEHFHRQVYGGVSDPADATFQPMTGKRASGKSVFPLLTKHGASRSRTSSGRMNS